MLYECLDSLDYRLFYSCSCWPIIDGKMCITHNQTNANWFESWWTLLLFICLWSHGVEWYCNGSFNIADLQLGDVNLKVFNIIKGINESKTDLFHVKKRFISCKCRYEFDDRNCNLKQKCNNNLSDVAKLCLET